MHTHMHAHSHTHTHMHDDAHEDTYQYMYICVHTHTFMCTHAHIHMRMHAHMHAHTHVRKHTLSACLLQYLTMSGSSLVTCMHNESLSSRAGHCQASLHVLVELTTHCHLYQGGCIRDGGGLERQECIHGMWGHDLTQTVGEWG
jgi:hypothetical protein